MNYLKIKFMRMWNRDYTIFYQTTYTHTLITLYTECERTQSMYQMNMEQTLSERVLNDANISLWIARKQFIVFISLVSFHFLFGERSAIQLFCYATQQSWCDQFRVCVELKSNFAHF